jgi:hypothetical protein
VRHRRLYASPTFHRTDDLTRSAGGSMNCSNTFIPYNVTTLPFSTGQQKGSEPYAIDM